MRHSISIRLHNSRVEARLNNNYDPLFISTSTLHTLCKIDRDISVRTTKTPSSKRVRLKLFDETQTADHKANVKTITTAAPWTCPCRRFVSKKQRVTIYIGIPIRAGSILTLDTSFWSANIFVMDHATATYDLVQNADRTNSSCKSHTTWCLRTVKEPSQYRNLTHHVWQL